ncbi:MAG TPA: chemotaxis protein CheW [Longimicrobiales bacterium]|nr:chemotaxis protein CheW [Longimicrobiales bacterium]
MSAYADAPTYHLPRLILRVSGNLYALEISHVREMVRMVEVNPVPHAPDNVRGVTHRRNRSLTVLDLRRRLGMRGMDEEIQELVGILRAREADHLRWVDELEACVREGREFTLARDPGKCAFGVWYAGFRTDNLTLRGHLKRFEQPHARIAEARETTLAALRRLFGDAVTLLEESVAETLVILENGDQLLGLTTDEVDSVEHLAEGSIREIALPGDCWHGDLALVRRTAMTARSDRLVLVLEAEALLSDVGSLAVMA